MTYTDIKGFKISKLSLGTVALGIDYGVFKNQNKPDSKEGAAILSSTLKAGINTFDTAREYGSAEELLGHYQEDHHLDMSKINFVTKFKISAKNSRNFEAAKAEVYQSVKVSLETLKIKQIPICLFHMVYSLDINEILDILPQILKDLKKDGLIKIGGISIDHPSEAEHFLDQPEIEAIQLAINVFDQRLIRSNVLSRLHELNKIVFVRSVFLKGLFFRSIDDLTGNLKGADIYLKKLQELAMRSNMSIGQFAFSYVRDLEGITSIVFGAEKESHVIENIELLKGEKIPTKIREEAYLFFQDVPEEILTPRMWSV